MAKTTEPKKAQARRVDKTSSGRTSSDRKPEGIALHRTTSSGQNVRVYIREGPHKDTLEQDPKAYVERVQRDGLWIKDSSGQHFYYPPHRIDRAVIMD